jgi:predicted RNA-binding protein YlqC (UPF0109 family)
MPQLVPIQTPVEIIETIVRAFVDYPTHVSVEEVFDNPVSTLYLRVDVADFGKVIGDQGQMERSLEEILRAESFRLKHRYTLQIIHDFNVNVQ